MERTIKMQQKYLKIIKFLVLELKIFETFKKKYDKNGIVRNLNKTHPHQIHFEFLSETGLFGYFHF